MSTQEIALRPAAEASLPLTARLHDLVVTVDHKKLGLMYVCTSLVFFLFAGFMVLMIRIQLVAPTTPYCHPMFSIASLRCTAPRWSFWSACRLSPD